MKDAKAKATVMDEISEKMKVWSLMEKMGGKSKAKLAEKNNGNGGSGVYGDLE